MDYDIPAETHIPAENPHYPNKKSSFCNQKEDLHLLVSDWIYVYF